MEGRERKKDKGGEERGMIGTVKTRGAHTRARACGGVTSNRSVADTLAPRCHSLTSLPLSANQLHAGATARPF